MAEQPDEILTLLRGLATVLPTLATKDDVAALRGDMTKLQEGQARLEQGQARLEDEQRQIKESLGAVRLREIGRRDGRIDELTMVVTSTLKHPEAAD